MLKESDIQPVLFYQYLLANKIFAETIRYKYVFRSGSGKENGFEFSSSRLFFISLGIILNQKKK